MKNPPPKARRVTVPPPAPNNDAPAPPSRTLVLAAFAAVYIIWGSTYLGIKVAVESIPPFVLGGARFLIAGTLLFAWQRLRGQPMPSRAHWINAAIVGALLLGAGNGGVNWAAQSVPSGLCALLIGITPLWFALMDWLRPGGIRPRRQTLIGVSVGFAGMLLLVGNRDALQAHHIPPSGLAALLMASVCWAGGSLFARYTPKPASPLMGIALQMIAGGAILMLMGLAAGEWNHLDPARFSTASIAAFAYLTAFGSLIGFTAYSWLLKASTPARVSTYAFVNPVIAVFLGWLIADEPLTARTLLSAAVIVAGVALLTTARSVTK